MRTWQSIATPVGIAVALVGLYMFTMPRTLTLEDSGFFLLAAHDAGVNHPPGYPLHALLGHAFALLPLGEIAVRIALLSALFGAASCALLWFLARSLGLGHAASALAAGAYGVSGAFWSQAIVVEVYTLNSFLCFAILACCRHAALRDADAPLFGAALLAGLGLANHWPLCVLTWPGAAALLWPRRRRILRRAPWLAAVLLAPALALYTWMVWRSRREGAIAFLGPIEDLGAALRYVLRRIYAERDLGGGTDLAQAPRLAGFYLLEGARQLGWPAAALAAFGFVMQWRRWPRTLALALCWCCFGVLAALVATQEFRSDLLARSIVRVYPLVPWGVLALWLALGFYGLARRARGYVQAPGASGFAAAALVLWIAASHWSENDRRGDRWALRYARTVLEALPERAVLFTSDDLDTAPIGFVHRVLGVRPDVAVYNDVGLVFPNRIVDVATPAAEREQRLAHFVRSSRRPVFAIDDWGFPGLGRRPYGLFYEVAPRGGVRRSVTREAQAALEELVLADPGRHPWNRYHRDRLVASFAHWVAVRLARPRQPAERARLLALRDRLAQHFTGELALLAFELRRGPPDELWRSLEALTDRLLHESDITTQDVAALFHLRGMVRRRQGLEQEAGAEFERAVDTLPKPHLNRPAIVELLRHYARTGQSERVAALLRRFEVVPGELERLLEKPAARGAD